MFVLFRASLTMSIVILLLLLLNKVLTNKAPAVFRYYMWVIILVGLIIPFRPSISVPFDPVQIPIPSEAVEMANTHTQDETLQPALSSSDAVSEVDVSVPGRPISYVHVFFGIWLAGALAVFAFHLLAYSKFSASVSRWGVAVTDEKTLRVFQNVWDDMALSGNPIAVEECMLISSPMLIGYRRPKILLPEKTISPDELEHVFRHELTHYRRRDLWMNLLVLLVSAMYWFNPLVYLMAKTIRSDCEVACDEAAVIGNNTDKRKHYGETIIGFIGVKNAMTPVLSTYFYGGKNSMKKRLFSIMDTSQKGKSLATVCAIAIAMVTLLLGSAFAAATVSNNPTQNISEAKAKSIALAHAGLTESQVTFLKIHLDRDDGRTVYDIDFYSGNVEYDYEINAITGAILEFDKDIENYSIPNNSTNQGSQPAPQPPANTNQNITEAKAKSIALAHAGLAESQVSRMKVQLDRDDGLIVYEVDFHNGRTEYEYEIDANTGSILKADIDYDDD